VDALFQFFFKYRPVVFQSGSFAFGWPVPPLLLVVLLAGAVGVGVWLYVRSPLALQRRDRWVLGGLRVAAVLVLVFCLARPLLVVSIAIPQRNVVGIVIDDSRSMRIADAAERPRGDFALTAFGGPDSALYSALAKRFQLRFFRTSGAGGRATDLAGLQLNGSRTHLATALMRAEEELAGAPVAGMVLVSDGADNTADLAGATPMMEQLLALRARRIPVYAIGVGSERFDKDIELSRVDVPRVILKDASLLLEAVVTQRGYAGTRVPLIVEDSGRIVASREIALPRDGEAMMVRLRIPTNEAGARTLRLRLTEQPGELIKENNERAALVVVRDRREKILYLEGEPRFELKFIRRAIEQDNNLQLVTLLRSAKDKFFRMSVDDSLELSSGFPRTREELFGYRAVVLGSMEASFFTVDQLRMLADFVSIRGGGLLVMGGRRAFAEGGFGGTALADALPIELGRPGEFADSGATEVTLSPTAAGAFHPATQLAPNDSATVQLWKVMPPLTMVNEIGRPKPGATVLLEAHPADGSRSVPGLVFQRYGRGKAIAFTVQDSWLWQMHAKVAVEDQSHETFWRQLLRWLVSDVPERVDVLTADGGAIDEASPIQVTVSDSAFLRANGAAVTVDVTSPSGQQSRFPLEWATERDGEYRGSLVPGENGVHEVRVSAVLGRDTLKADAAYVRAAEPTAEFFGAQLRPSLLRQIADETGGRYYSTADAGKVAEDIVYSASGATVVERRDLWDMPIVFLLLLGAVGGEWLLRRRRGLA
jgi:uncharacterized membrane protein